MIKNYLALIGIVVAGVVAVGSQPGRFTLWETIIGFILFTLLLSIDPKGFPIIEKISFWVITSFCIIITFGFFIENLLDIWPCFDVPSGKQESEMRHLAFFCIWVILSFIVPFFIPTLQSRIARFNKST